MKLSAFVFLSSVLCLGCLSFVCAIEVQSSISSVSSRLSHRLAGAATPSSQDSTDSASLDTPTDPFTSFKSALSEALVAKVNGLPNVTWNAGLNTYFKNKSYDFLKASCGLKMDRMQTGVTHNATQLPSMRVVFQRCLNAQLSSSGVKVHSNVTSRGLVAQPVTANLPQQFDARAKWAAQCPSLNDVRDQAGCGSCWAVAAASAMTDRHCIASNGADQPYISAAEILTCCGLTECGSCQGGYPINAWQFWVNSGVVTGANYGSSTTCQPYPWAPCSHHVEGSTRPECAAQDSTPSCSNACSHGRPFASDKSFGSSAYQVLSYEAAIMDEIMNYGPVEAGFMVYEDFPHYRSGIYKHVTGNMLGGHAVKMIGWGEEAGEKYWLVQNSWNTDWGNLGYFKIARGINECYIEDMVFAGRVKKATDQIVA